MDFHDIHRDEDYCKSRKASGGAPCNSQNDERSFRFMFVGLQNYIKLFSDSNFAPFFWRALRNNFVFFAVHMLVQNPIGLLLAALLAEGGRIRNFFRTVIFMPTVLSVVIIGFIWQLI